MVRFVGISDEAQINVKDVVKVKLPQGTFRQGDVLVAEDLVSGTRGVYQGVDVTDATNEEVVIIINQDVYHDEFGNRHDLVANVGKIHYDGETIITGLRASKNVILEMTVDCINGTPVVGEYLIPSVASGDERRLVPSATADGATVYKVEAESSISKPQSRAKTVIVRMIK